PSHVTIADSIAGLWQRQKLNPVIVQLCGADESNKRAIATAACNAVGLRMHVLPADYISGNAAELEGLARLWERESRLGAGALYIDAGTIERNDSKMAAQVSRFLEIVSSPLVLSTTERWRALRRAIRTVEVGKPTLQEQRRIWETELKRAPIHLNGQVANL